MANKKSVKADFEECNFKAMFTENPTPMILDDQGKIIAINKAFRKLTGYLSKDVLGKSRVEIGLLNQTQSDFLKNALIKEGHIKGYQIQARHKDGSSIIGIVSVMPVLTKGKSCFLFTFQNQTEVVNEIAKRQEIQLHYDLSPNLIATSELDGRLMKFNQTWRKVLGYETHMINQSRFIDFVHPDEQMMVKIALKKLTKVENLELRVRKVDGSYLHVEWNIRKQGPQIHYNGKDVTKRVKAFSALNKERELFKATIYSLNEAIIICDGDAKITLMNQLAEEYTGWKSKDAIGNDFDLVYHCLDLLHHESVPNVVKTVMASNGPIESEENTVLISKDKTERFVKSRCNPIRDQDAKVTGAVITFIDRSQSMELEYEVEAFLNVNLDILCVSDKNGYFHRVNKRFEEILGYTQQDIEGKLFTTFIVEDDTVTSLNALSQLQDNKVVSGFTNRYRCKDGSLKYIEWHSQPGRGKFVYSSARDVTDHFNSERSLRNQATHDQLTGLYNRHYYEERGLEEIRRSQRTNQPLSVIMFDIDHFKHINDTYGHPIGDLVLKDIAQITQNSIRNTDLLFRVGGEEFVILTLDTPLYGAKRTAEKILERLRQNVHPIVGTYTASFGVCEKLEDETMIELYQRVDAVLYQSKHNGRNQVTCDQVSSEKPIARIEFTFKPEWESGNALIDAQHQSLIMLANQIINMTPNEFEKISRLIEKLIQDITIHFKEEEEVLSRIGFPLLDQHQTFHTQLLKHANAIKNENIHQTLKATSFFSFIVDELVVGHIIQEDQKYFALLRSTEKN